MAISKPVVVVTYLLVAVALSGCTRVRPQPTEEPVCRWNVLKAPAYQPCVAPRGPSRSLQCGFLVVLSDELCRSGLRAVQLYLFVGHVEGFAGGLIRVAVAVRGRRDTLVRWVHWTHYPTEADFRKDARQLIAEVVEWLRCPSPNRSPPATLAVAILRERSHEGES